MTSVSSWASLAAQRVKNLPSMWETLKKGMATHLSIVAWRIPWREELWATVHRVTKNEHDPATDTPVSSNLATFIYNLKIQ